ncbi:MAG: Dyp-type peroxidase, partial [Ilumatobacteraceae bacterium]
DGDHGIVFMAIGASISRQFEFVQQQWVNYSNDFKLANDRDPVIGNHGADGGRMVIEADPEGTDPPFFCTGIPRFVETRGGDYFFVPSLTALAGIARGTIDPT